MVAFTVSTLLLLGHVTNAQTAISKAEAAFNALQKWYNPQSGLWNTCGWWNSANCMTAVADLALVDSNVANAAKAVFTNTYARAPAYNPQPVGKTFSANGVPETLYPAGWPLQVPLKTLTASSPSDARPWLDGSYDDNAWWALGWIAAYDLTKNSNYLQLAQGIFEDMTTTWPSNCSGGGIYWQSSRNYVNAITNELFLSIAAHLANRVPSRKAYYVNWANREWTWFKKAGMINAQGTINDGLNSATCMNNGQTTWTYNQGVVLGGLTALYHATGNKSLLTEAANIATAAIKSLTDANGVLHEPCEPRCSPDGTQFKGIFMRNLRKLHDAAPQPLFKKTIVVNAASIWNKDRNSANQFSVNWAGPFYAPANASTQGSAFDALVAAIHLP